MGKYKTSTSKETIAEADKIAKATQRPGQSKEQTKLIAQGIQKGIEQFKRQQKEKTREINKKLKNVRQKTNDNLQEPLTQQLISSNNKSPILPWALLALSWVCFVVYWLLN